MIYIWNIYEPADPQYPGEDPFDIFVYSLRRDFAPRLNETIFLEGQRHLVFAIEADNSRNEVNPFASEEQIYKVCVKKIR